MTIARVYSPGWGIGEKLTSAQQNALDINTTYAIDKRAGQQDVFGSVLAATGVARIIGTIATGPDRDWTFHFNGNGASASSASVVRIPTLTSARSYNLVHSGVTGGDRILFYIEGTGMTPSGYVDIKNSVGTGIFRLGRTSFHHGPFTASGTTNFNSSAEGDSAEVIFNGTSWGLGPAMRPKGRTLEFTSTSATSWVCPPGIHEVELYGYGGGGGGAAGSGGTTTQNLSAGGGGGGGGSLPHWKRVKVTPGREYEFLCGAGGTGGATSGLPGAAGGDSIFREKVTGIALVTWRGADFGTTAPTSTSATIYGFGFGGVPARDPAVPAANRTLLLGTTLSATLIGLLRTPGTGGISGGDDTTVYLTGASNGTSSDNFSGGFYGDPGGVGESNYRGGGAGGGGGGGAGGEGAVGGDGGDSGAVSNNGTAGASAVANSGAGGGGGGGGGCGSLGGGIAGAGGAGGSGKIVLIF